MSNKYIPPDLKTAQRLPPDARARLIVLAKRFWGKAMQDSGSVGWHPLVSHCLDVAAVTYALLEKRPSFVRWAGQTLRLQDKSVIGLLVWLGAIHDLGKFAENFQWKVPELAEAHGHEYRDSNRHHDEVGTMMWSDIKKSLSEKNEVLAQLAEGDLDQLVRSVCSHHGTPVSTGMDRYAYSTSTLSDGCEFAQLMLDIFVGQPSLPQLPIADERINPRQIALLCWHLNGLLTVADWVGSDTHYFPYASPPDLKDAKGWLESYWTLASQRALTAIQINRIGNPSITEQSGGEVVFGVGVTPHLRPLQRLCEDLSLSNEGPTIFVIEDSTGSGKTEAALLLAIRQMQSGQADGIFFALPTMATANGMFRRLEKIADRIFCDPESASLVLSHSQAKLLRELVALQSKDQYEDAASEMASAWLSDHRKAALLANVGVGTIDQALLGILRVKHLSLRLFGLFRKVLIIDEVHAYDAYQHSLLKTLVEIHASSGGNVILLSATLPAKERGELVKAFGQGRDLCLGRMVKPTMGFFAPLNASAPKVMSGPTPYPSITYLDEQGIESSHAVKADPSLMRSYDVDYQTDFDEIVQKAVSAAQQGRCVAWVRNTVQDALTAFDAIQRAINDARDEIEAELFHARFAFVDRIRIENGILQRFGPTSGHSERRGRILVATQVIEQSLDLDFDVLISDLAPIDLLIQRAGRLCRHRRDQLGNVLPIGMADQRGGLEITVFGPPRDHDPVESNWLKRFSAGTAAVYEHHGRMWLTAKVLADQLDLRTSPREPIEAVYGGQRNWCGQFRCNEQSEDS
jgi:CRISPR-associated endonuclease/helicase Cas3